jgi:Na+/proline symporter
MSPLLFAILGYLVLQFGVGVWASRRVRNEADYLLAGRSLGYPLATFSFFATWFGAETVMGSAGTAYGTGVSFANAEPFGYGLCLVGMGLIFARPLWRRQLTTLADLFRTRYSTQVERVAAAILIPSSVLWAAAQVRAFGHVLSLAGTFELETAIAVATGFTIVYTTFGGLLADAVTDLVQGTVVVVALVVLLVAVILALPEGTTLGTVLAAPGAITLRPPPETTWLALLEEWSIPVCGSLIATELVGRVVATRTEAVASRSALLAGGMYLVVGLIPLVIGLVGREVVPVLADPEQVVPAVARQLLPTGLFIVFVGGLLSAILSTVDSTLLVSSGLLSHNLVVPFFGITNEQWKVRVARAGVVGFGLVAFFLAIRADGVFALVEAASAFGSSGALVVVCFALFSTWGGARTAMATLLLGLLTYLAGTFGGAEAPFLTSLIVSLGTYIVGSALEGRRAPVPAARR